jgi:ADP-ribosylation factor-like protein 8
MPTSATELHSLLAVPSLAGVPLLVIGNKNDLPEAIGVDEMIAAMGLERIRDRAVSVSRCCNL